MADAVVDHDSLKACYRAIPAVQILLQCDDFQGYPLSAKYLKKIIREAIQQIRNAIARGHVCSPQMVPVRLKKDILSRLAGLTTPGLKRVINATGIILHSNLGRAPLSNAVQQHLQDVAAHYCNLEFDCDSGKRGQRMAHIELLLCLITGAEAALAVNNGAAAVLLVLNTLAREGEVLISRGEQIEIGGTFRMPEIMTLSGAKMVEIGTTNKTHLQDYQQAVTGHTAAILKVHASNYRVCGFTSSVEIPPLVQFAAQEQLPLIYDLGSGWPCEELAESSAEPLVQAVLKQGVDVAIFSGDKLLGGPQAGLIVGKQQWLQRIKANHLSRALRCDKLIYAALEATLRAYLQPDTLKENLPIYKMLHRSRKTLRELAIRLQAKLSDRRNRSIDIVDSNAQMGAGALPLEKIPSISLRITLAEGKIEHLAAALRNHTPPIISCISRNALYLNLKTISDDELDMIACALNREESQSGCEGRI